MYQKFTDKDGNIYEGEVLCDRVPHGTGRMISADGSTCLGKFVHGEFTGIGQYICPNGNSMKAILKKGMPSGFGTLKKPTAISMSATSTAANSKILYDLGYKNLHPFPRGGDFCIFANCLHKVQMKTITMWKKKSHWSINQMFKENITFSCNQKSEVTSSQDSCRRRSSSGGSTI